MMNARVVIFALFCLALTAVNAAEPAVEELRAGNKFFWISYWDDAGQRTISVENGVPVFDSLNRSSSFVLVPRPVSGGVLYPDVPGLGEVPYPGVTEAPADRRVVSLEGAGQAADYVLLFREEPRVFVHGASESAEFGCVTADAENLPGGRINVSLTYSPLCARCGEQYLLHFPLGVVDQGVQRDLAFILPIAVPCDASALLVTDSRHFDADEEFDFGPELGEEYEAVVFREALLAYVDKLASQGISARFFDFGDAEALKAFSIDKAPKDVAKETKKSSRRYVDSVKQVHDKTESKQIIILGGAKVIPMPVVTDPFFHPNTEVLTKTGIFVSDDFYAMISEDSLPFYSVARFPTPTTGNSIELAAFSMLVAVKSSEQYFALSSDTVSRYTGFVGDACGAAHEFDECYKIKENSAIYKYLFEGQPGYVTCDSDAARCRLSPSFCSGGAYMVLGAKAETQFTDKEVAENCNSSLIESVLADNKVIYASTHGRNYKMYGSRLDDAEEKRMIFHVFSADYLLNYFVENMEVLPYYPVVVTSACRTGMIADDSQQLKPFDYGDSLTLSFLRAGARAFVGRTGKMFFADRALVELLGGFLRGSGYFGDLLLDLKLRMGKLDSARLQAALADARSLREKVQEEMRQVKEGTAETGVRRTVFGEVAGCPWTPVEDEDIVGCLELEEMAFVDAARHFGITREPVAEALPGLDEQRARIAAYDSYLSSSNQAYLAGLREKESRLTKLIDFLETSFDAQGGMYSPVVTGNTRYAESELTWTNKEKAFGGWTSLSLHLYGDPFQKVVAS